MWVICFYLNANKIVRSETMIGGGGGGGSREERKCLVFLCSPALLSQQLVRQVPPGASGIPPLVLQVMPRPPAALYAWRCTFNLA